MSFPKIKIWLMAIRPKTLWAAFSPVMIGTAMAFADEGAHIPSALAALLGALLIQIGTNLANDYFDYRKGADNSNRLGPTRVTQAGLIKPGTVKKSFIIIFSAAAFISFYLIERGGWPIAVIGVLSILSGILYTAGPRPLGYLGLGEVFVFVFFGPVAVAGTYFVQTQHFNPLTVIAGIAPGLLSLAVLAVNNLRDIDSDRKANKRTLAVRFGRSFALSEYLFAVSCASFIPFVLFVLTRMHAMSLLAVPILLLAIPTIKIVFTALDGPSLNAALAKTGKLLFIYSFLFSFGWLL